MKRVKTNGVIAFLFCVCVFMCSIGCVMGLERDKIYQAPDLMLTQGQAKYNLYDGIEYDEKNYDLTVCNQGEFDINRPGSYTVEYMLTPLKTSSDFEPEGGQRGSNPSATKSDILPAAIPAGEYKVILSAVHPVTGVVFTMERTVEVRAAVRLDYPAGSGKVSEQFGSLTSGWSQCVPAYRFALVSSPPDSASLAPDLVLKTEMKGGEAGG